MFLRTSAALYELYVMIHHRKKNQLSIFFYRMIWILPVGNTIFSTNFNAPGQLLHYILGTVRKCNDLFQEIKQTKIKLKTKLFFNLSIKIVWKKKKIKEYVEFLVGWSFPKVHNCHSKSSKGFIRSVKLFWGLSVFLE